MAKKVVNIDDILADNQLEVIIQGKTYVANDFDLTHFLRLMDTLDDNDPEAVRIAIRDQVASTFEVNPEELDHLGLRTLTLVVQQIRDWILGGAEEAVGPDNANP